jgi:hypothetical protein
VRLVTIVTIALLGLATVAVAQRVVSPPEVNPPPPVPSQPPSPRAGEPNRPQQPQPGTGQQSATNEQRGTDQVPLTVKVLPSPKSQADIDEEKRRAYENATNEKNLTNGTWTMAVMKLFRVFVGGAQLILFFVQLRYIRESLNDAKIAATAAKDGAAAAEKYARVTEAAMVAAERAYVSIRSVFFVRDPIEGELQGITAGFRLQNTGNTPTKQMTSHSSMRIFTSDIPENFEFPDLDERREARYFIAPKQWIGGFIFRITREELISCIGGRRRILIWGWADYNDTFPETPRRRTEFCHEIIVGTDPTVGPIERSISASQYRRHNAADDECQHRPKPYSAT